MRRLYIYQQPDWPRFRWRHEGLADRLARVRYRQGRLIGRMENLGFDFRREIMLNAVTEDVVKSSEIEGEILDLGQVRSSVARQLGMDVGGLGHSDRNVDGIVELTLDATQNYDRPLTRERLFDWHAALFPTGRSGMRRIRVGDWRDDGSGPMQVVSGPIGRERIHFEAPPASRLEEEMYDFLDWFNSQVDMDGALRAALAHLWFVTVHPLEDGNGRIARAITDMSLARSEESSQRYYSVSSQIRRERSEYYGVLERTQKGTMDVSEWLVWFLGCLDGALEHAEAELERVMVKARFWERIAHISINERQRVMINRLLNGFRGNLTTSRWARIAKCSQDTALRDISALVRAGVLERNPGGGRSTSYRLVDMFPMEA